MAMLILGGAGIRSKKRGRCNAVRSINCNPGRDGHRSFSRLASQRRYIVEIGARLTFTGTHEGELFGIPPTRKKLVYAGVAIFHIKNTKITDCWVLADLLALLDQLGGDKAVLPARSL